MLLHIHIACYLYYLIFTINTWSKELPTDADSATTPNPTESEKYALQAQEL